MTQTPRSFDPQDSEGSLPAQNPVAADAPSRAEDSYPAGGTDYPTGTDLAPGSAADTPGSGTGEAPRGGTTAAEPAPVPDHQKVTRAGMVWTAVASALVVLILLITFILQNQDYVLVKFFGLEGSVPLGIALLIAAVGGGVLVAIAGAARIIQLRLAAHRQRATLAGQGTRKR